MHREALIRDLIQAAPIGQISALNFIASGYASDAYKIDSSEGSFIALTPKADALAPPDYAYYFAILKTLRSIGYKFAPEAVYLVEDRSLILMTLVPGQAFSWINDASDTQQEQAVKLLVAALLDLRAASFEQCQKLYRKLTGNPLPVMTLEEDVKKYMTDWFKLAQTGQPDQMLTKWIEPKVALCEAYARQVKPGRHKTFVHGDTSEGNILLTPNMQLYLIDWDGSSFNQFPDGWDDFGIAYLMNHVPVFQKYRNLVIDLLSGQGGIDQQELERRITQQQENIKLGDIMWAYMMHARATAGEIKSQPPSFFMKTAQQRIADYERDFARASFLN